MVSAKSIRLLTVAAVLVLSVVAATPNRMIRPVNAAQTLDVVISNLAFSPQNLTIRLGDTVNWTNNDQLIYTLWFVRADDKTTYKQAGTEGVSDPIIPGASWSQTFNEPVTIQYYSLERLWITGFITVTPPAPPVASFTHSPTIPIVGQNVTFNASASYDPDGTITQYLWDFGDGKKVSETDPVSTHAFTTAGIYTVTLIVMDNDAQIDTASELLAVKQIIRDVAVVSVTPSPTEVTMGQNVTVIVVVKNDGNVSETFNVAAYYNNTVMGTQPVSNLAPGTTQSRSFTWNTAGVAEGEYTIKAVASAVSGETDTSDNTGTAPTKVKVTAPPRFPIELVIAAVVVAIIIIGASAYIYFTKKKTPKPPKPETKT